MVAKGLHVNLSKALAAVVTRLLRTESTEHEVAHEVA